MGTSPLGLLEPSGASWVLVLQGFLCIVLASVQMWGLCAVVGHLGDHLSPNSLFFCLTNRNYVFQRRYVRFDGKNLMYFSSEKVRVGGMWAEEGLCCAT